LIGWCRGFEWSCARLRFQLATLPLRHIFLLQAPEWFDSLVLDYASCPVKMPVNQVLLLTLLFVLCFERHWLGNPRFSFGGIAET